MAGCDDRSAHDEWLTPWVDGSYYLDDIGPIVRARRAVPVPGAMRERAIEMLRDSPVLALTERELAGLFPGGAPTREGRSNAVVDAAQAQLKTLDRSGTYAEQLRSLIASEQAHLRRLRPYLVRAVSANDAGVFAMDLVDDELFLMSTALGCPDLSKTPLVVFLESEPKKVHVFISTAL